MILTPWQNGGFVENLWKWLKLVESVAFSKSSANISTTIHSVFGHFDLKLTNKRSKKKSVDSLCHSEWIWIWKNRFVLYWTQFPGYPLVENTKIVPSCTFSIAKSHFQALNLFFCPKKCKKSGVLMFQIRKFWKNWSSTSNFKEKFQYKLVPSSESVLDIIHSDVA